MTFHQHRPQGYWGSASPATPSVPLLTALHWQILTTVTVGSVTQAGTDAQITLCPLAFILQVQAKGSSPRSAWGNHLVHGRGHLFKDILYYFSLSANRKRSFFVLSLLDFWGELFVFFPKITSEFSDVISSRLHQYSFVHCDLMMCLNTLCEPPPATTDGR